jgi:predicted hydrocarbon binding protein
MDQTSGDYREIVVPVSIFSALRRELERESGPLATIHSLRAAGYAAGEQAASAFPTPQNEDVGAIPENEFWSRITAFFNRRGWGTLSRDGSPEAVGILISDDWVESAGVPDDADEGSSCSFTTGFLSGFLSRLAGGRVAVLEVTCRGLGDGRCTFAFGSEAAIHELYGHLLEGVELQRALTSL